MSSYSIAVSRLSGPFQALRMNIYPSTVTDKWNKKMKTVLQKVICYSKRIIFDAVSFSLYQLYVCILNSEMERKGLDVSINTLKMRIINTCKKKKLERLLRSREHLLIWYDRSGILWKCSQGGPWRVRDKPTRQTALIGRREVREEKVTIEWPGAGGRDTKRGRKPEK